MDIRRLVRCALLVSLALCLSYLENLLSPLFLPALPGIKLGLANVVTLVALYGLKRGSALMVLLLRCLLGSIFAGNISALLFSLSGGLLAMLTMAIAGRISCFSIYGVSVLGAAAHGCGQILIARLIMPTAQLDLYLCYLLLTALPMGMATACMGAAVARVLLNINGGLEGRKCGFCARRC